MHLLDNVKELGLVIHNMTKSCCNLKSALGGRRKAAHMEEWWQGASTQRGG